MAMQAENMDYDKLKELVDSLSCRSISPLVLPEVPLGSFTLMTFPMTKVEGTENPGVHYFDLIVDHADDIDFFGLSSSYKLACEKKDLALLPAPFGLKAACPKETTIQIAILKQPDGKKAILKHASFPDKVKVSFVQQICFGSPYRPLFMKSNPKVGRKILQYCFENLGGHAFRCFDLSSQATRRGQSKTSMPFEDKEDAEIDEGFNYILRTAPRSSCEMAQLRWQTKELRNKSSPIFGWPGALISQALRNLSSDGALAKKEPHWPIPLSPLFYDRAILTTLEKIWDFDQSALILLGEPGTGKSPLGRSVLMAQVRHNQARFNLDGHPCVRCTPQLDFLRGEPGCVLMGDFLDDTSLSILDMKLVKAFLDVGLYESMAWARWGASKWVQNQPRAVADNTYDADLDLPDHFLDHITFETFYKLVRPAFKESASRAHMDAVFKRAAFIVNTKDHIYYRPAGINLNPVHRIPILREGFLTEAGRQVYGNYKSGNKDMPEKIEEELQKEQAWVSMLMKQKMDQRKVNQADEENRRRLRAALFAERPPPPNSALDILENQRADQVTIKRELAEKNNEVVFKKAKVWSQLVAQQPGACIDLDDSDKENEATSVPEAIPNPEWDVAEDDEEGVGHGFGIDYED